MTGVFASYDSVANSVADWRRVVPVTHPEAIGSYLNGSFANRELAELAFPDALHYCYDVNGRRPDADALDVERGDATPAHAPGWFHAHTPRAFILPNFYAAASDTQAVIDALAGDGIGRDRFLIQSAHFGAGQHICGPKTCGFPQADWTQWFTSATVDQSTGPDTIFTPHAPADPHHYDWFLGRTIELGGRRINERATVQQYDQLRDHSRAVIFAHRPRLRVLRGELQLLAARIVTVAEERRDKDGQPSLSLYHRDWRRDQLDRRANGARVT